MAAMYDPVTARFIQEDTYTGQYNDPLSLNLYTYCHNEPLMYSDPTGHVYVYHGQTLSEDSTSDNMAERAQNAEYSGKHISNAAEAAMVSAGFGGKAFKAPTRVTKSGGTITEEAKEEQNHEPPTPCPTPTPTPLNPDAKKNWFESFIDEERYSDTPLGKLIRTFDVAGQAVNGIGGAIKGTGEALGAGAYAGIDTGVAFFERMTGSISADELLYRYTNNMKTIDSIKYGTTAGAMETVAGAPFSILGAAEYISNGTNFINESTSNYISEADDKIVNSLDLNREDYENAKGIIPTCLLVVSLGAQYNSLRAQDAIKINSPQVQGDKCIPLKRYNEILESGTKNASAQDVMLGKYDGGGPTSYITQAGDKYKFFDLGKDGWNSVKTEFGFTNNDMLNFSTSHFWTME